MDVADALAHLTEISPQLTAVVLLDPQDAVAGSQPASDPPSQRLAETARRLIAQGERVSSRRSSLNELEVTTAAGSVFAVRERGWTIAATATRGAPATLVRSDLRICLRRVAEAADLPRVEPEPASAAPERKPRPRRASATAKTAERNEAGATADTPDPAPKRTRTRATAKKPQPKLDETSAPRKPAEATREGAEESPAPSRAKTGTRGEDDA